MTEMVLLIVMLKVSAIIGSLSDIRPPNWVLSEQYQTFVQKADNDEVQWQPDISYYISHVRKIADSKKHGFPFEINNS